MTFRLHRAALAAAIALAGCGGAGETAARQGGTVTVISDEDFADTDCGRAYSQYEYMLCYATQRPLYSYRPGSVSPDPDLAAALPEIGDGGRTLTIRLRPGVRFSPPVDREVVAEDVKYALERTFFSSVPNSYAEAYLGDIVGAKAGARPGTRIRGIEAPDDRTLVLRLRRPTTAAVTGALSLPGSAPVPAERAARHDRRRISTYDRHQVATGPYMIEQDASGRTVGYRPGKALTVVRNPSWDASTDYRPAPLDGFTFRAGTRPKAATRRILDGRGQLSGDFTVPAAEIAREMPARPGQFAVSGSDGFSYVAMNTQRRPFRDVDVRRAVIAVFDREAMQRAQGGAAAGDIASHFIPPGIPGFEEAGGGGGPPLDYLANPRGDLALARQYLRAAGYPRGRYTGRAIRMVGVKGGAGRRVARVARAQFSKLGFRVKLQLVSRFRMYTRFCQRPRSRYDVCPNVGWIEDFNDPQPLLDLPFNGRTIIREGNVNHALFDHEALNAAIEAAKPVADPVERARAWGEIDRRLMERAAAVPWLWDRRTAVASSDVDAVLNQFNSSWDMSFTGLK